MADKEGKKRRITFEEAREQAADYFGFASSVIIQTKDDQVFEIPNPGLMDDDQQERYDALQDRVNDFDHEEIEVPIIEYATIENEDGTVTREPRLLGHRKEKQLVTPYRKNGELVGMSYNIELAKAIFGEKYEAFKKAGGRSSLINMEWARMNREMAERKADDPK